MDITDDDRYGDGTPQPASHAMDKASADFYVAYTGGQLLAYRHADGEWYLYAPREAGVADEAVPRERP